MSGVSEQPVEPDAAPSQHSPTAGADVVTDDETQSSATNGFRRNLPLVLSGISVLVAIASAVFAYNAAQDSYISDRRSELIAVVAQLDEKTRDGDLEEEAGFLIAQAVWLTGTVPDVPAAVYRQIANAILEETPAYQEDALPLLEEALRRSAAVGDEYEQVAALKVRARIFEAQGDLEKMREDYGNAIGLSASYIGPNLQRRHTVPAFTHASWGYAEVRAGECDAAAVQLSEAREHAAVITGPNLDEWITGLEVAVDGCSPDEDR